ncbi:hypothetical protein MHU86_25794 [Fragilaria crotonensis]|nr:hypothetical protein MHU86_25794 [Fragilaria crotonensis]
MSGDRLQLKAQHAVTLSGENNLASMMLGEDSSSSQRVNQQGTSANSAHSRHGNAALVSRTYSRDLLSQFLHQSPAHHDEELAIAPPMKQSQLHECPPSDTAAREKATTPKSRIRVSDFANSAVLGKDLQDWNVTKPQSSTPRRSSPGTNESTPVVSKEVNQPPTAAPLTPVTTSQTSSQSTPHRPPIPILNMAPRRVLVQRDAASVHSDLSGLTEYDTETRRCHQGKRSALKVEFSALFEAKPLNTKETARKKSVSFDTVSVRPYERILTVNPSCTSGPPIGLGWKYAVERHYLVDVFEVHRTQYRRSKSEILLSRDVRESMLLELGYDRKTLAHGVRQVIKVKNQRRQTLVNLGNAAFEEKVESAKNGVKSLFVSKRL